MAFFAAWRLHVENVLMTCFTVKFFMHFIQDNTRYAVTEVSDTPIGMAFTACTLGCDKSFHRTMAGSTLEALVLRSQIPAAGGGMLEGRSFF